jgi:3-isopropylmalate/(R)-2-methylmalate dehydratase small subunit
MEPIEVIHGKVTQLDRANVDTDQIMPKQFLKRVERTGFGEFLFYDWAKQPGWELPPNPILVAGENFGSGSSREHAPWGLQDYGFRALVAPSFADIFYSNCTKIGLLPVVLPEQHCRALAAAGDGQVDLRAQEVRYADADGALVTVSFEIDPEIRRRLLEGLDDVGVTLGESEDSISRYEHEREGRAPAIPVTTAL